MKLVLSGVLTMKPWGDDEELFLGASTPLVPLIALNAKEAGTVVAVRVWNRNDETTYVVSSDTSECHLTKYAAAPAHHTDHQEMQKDVVFRVGDFDVYAYLMQYVGEWCQLTVEMGGG